MGGQDKAAAITDVFDEMYDQKKHRLQRDQISVTALLQSRFRIYDNYSN